MTSSPPTPPALTDADLQQAADVLGCDLAAIKAVQHVESIGSGFLPNGDGRAKILFESRWFDHFTGGKYRSQYPNISTLVWDRRTYGPAGPHQYDRLRQAMELDVSAALKSASIGLYQVMGFNFAAAGFPDVQTFWTAMQDSESNQLIGFVKLCQAEHWDQYLIHKDWVEFALHYNGARERDNDYDAKLKAAYIAAGGVAA